MVALSKISHLRVVCVCGMDCSDFISQHAIPAYGRFACPGCEREVTAGPLPDHADLREAVSPRQLLEA
jgi:hypothetical protein